MKNYKNLRKLIFVLSFCSVNLQAQINDKYDVVWTRVVASSEDDYAWDVAVNSLGQSYIVGYTYGVLDDVDMNYGDSDFYARKFDFDGQILGTNYGGTAEPDGYEYVKTDYLNNVYYGGFFNNQIGLINKFDVNENLIWSKQNLPLRIWTLGSLANIYGIEKDANDDMVLSKFDTNGDPVWSQIFSHTLYPTTSTNIAVDLNGDIYLAGNTRGNIIATNAGGEDVFLMKFNSFGDFMWARQIGSSASEWANGIAFDSLGFIYITGKTGGDLGAPNQGRSDVYLVKYSPLGDMSWIQQFGTKEFDESSDIVIGTDDAIYITGGSEGAIGGFPPAGSSDQFVSKFNSFGNLLWTKQIDTPVYDSAYDIDVLPKAGALDTDVIYISGIDYSTTFGDGVLTKLALLDSDEDGLLDDWEINGIPYEDDNGIEQRFILPDANPMHKDLYFEIDSMNGVVLSDAAVTLVEDAFNFSPVSNPDGSIGIILHILKDDADLAHVNQWLTDGCWPLNYNAVRTSNFGTQSEQNNSELLAAKSKAYRYMVVADEARPQKIGGCGEKGGDNSVIFIGNGNYDDEDQAAVFMHEIGHNFGLGHGGGDGINGKPNYPSIMNYVLSYKADWNSTFWLLDYSSEGLDVMGALDESVLNEVRGIGTANGSYQDFIMPFGVNLANGNRALRPVKLNGSQVDFGDLSGTFLQDGLFNTSSGVGPYVSQDINYVANPPSNVSFPTGSSPGDVLLPFNDWANLKLPLSAALDTAALEITFPENELTDEAREWMEVNFLVLLGEGNDLIFYSGFE